MRGALALGLKGAEARDAKAMAEALEAGHGSALVAAVNGPKLLIVLHLEHLLRVLACYAAAQRPSAAWGSQPARTSLPSALGASRGRRGECRVLAPFGAVPVTVRHRIENGAEALRVIGAIAAWSVA